jgi:hypothetical protein
MPGPNLSGFKVIQDKLKPVVISGHGAVTDIVSKATNPVDRSIRSIGVVSELLPKDSSLREFGSALRTPFWAQPSFHADVVEHGPIAALRIRDITPSAAADVVNILSNVGPLAGIPAARGLAAPALAAGATGAGSFIGTTLADDEVAGGWPQSREAKVTAPDGTTKGGGYGGTAGGMSCEQVLDRYLSGQMSWSVALQQCPAIKTWLEM